MNIFELFGTIAINNKGANKGIDETNAKAKKLASAFGQVGQTALKVGKTVAKGMAVISAAGASAVGLLLKNSIGNYAEYEQLVGGIETLFKDSQGRMLKYAQNAYKTAGLSANEYMATATSFAASLLQGLGGDTEAAAIMTDMAIQDMADNANKMGTDISMIQNAYQGFAKQNYTMLDNLKLGYGGTATEMARLINDSGVMGETFVATAKNLNEISFAKIIEAIHVMQKEMGITGTTAKEAEKTITGSFNAWKSAGSNMLTAIASGDEKSIKEATEAFTAQTKVLLANLSPVVSDVISSIGTLLTELLPDIGQQALNFGSEIIAQIVNGITGSSITSEEVKNAINSILDIGSTALDNTLSFIKDTLQWIGDNEEFVKTAIVAIAGAFLGFKVATDPIGAAVGLIAAGLVALIANWESVKTAIQNALDKISEFFAVTIPDAWEDMVQDIADWWSENVEAPINRAIGLLKEFFNQPSFKEVVLRITTIQSAGGDLDDRKNNDPSIYHPSWQDFLDNGGLTEDEPTPPGKASGFRYVPYDNFRANLHMGEMVLPRNEAEEYRSGKNSGTDTSRLENIMQQVLGIMQQVATNTAGGQNVVLDTGILVGQMVPRLDAQLGTLTARKGRRG